MATLVLSAAGSAIGGSLGGSLAGMSTLALGKAAGAMLGNSIDQSVLGQGSATVETGHVEQFRMMGATEGTVLPRAFGRIRLAGQLIWSSRFLEAVNEENVGGKGGGGTIREYSYSISLALAVCEGEILRVGRIWADGQVLDQSDLVIRTHSGSDEQLPDPLIEAIEGREDAPAYRGTAYVVFENLPLGPFGNRIPQFNFEVYRRAEADEALAQRHPALDIQGVALMPGTGEYSLATEPVSFSFGEGNTSVANIHNDLGLPDIVASLDQMRVELPNAKSVSLIVTWFGNDLRCGHCELRPAVEQKEYDGKTQNWIVAGQRRFEAKAVSSVGDRPLFGGTPSDRSVIQSIRHMKTDSIRVMFYPFILMDIQENSGRPDPWSDDLNQPVIPWRGRITLSSAPGRPDTSDKTLDAANQVAQFFGTAKPGDFDTSSGLPVFTGEDGWSYRRFILHYAHLCAIAGGVDSFCIGSELRGLTQIRDGADTYPTVRELCALAEDVRSVVGSQTKIGYAADWSEYFGHHPADGSGDILFHLDPLWSHPEIDFVGIDNYMPLSDWREGREHLDAAFGSVYNPDYLKANIAGGEGFDWYYANRAGREAQDRLQIVDTAYGEDWVFRYKDLVSWWKQPHHSRLGGVRASDPTSWQPESKPIWFTEIGCPAVDKGTNQPNVFYDPKSSESALPYFSNGSQDETIQANYLQAVFSYWSTPSNNPVSALTSAPMVDLSHAFVWAWDARPWPDFPARDNVWSDGPNYELGHWLNGRATVCSLSGVVAEICGRCPGSTIDVSELYGSIVGFAIQDIESARQSLQPLMLATGFDGSSVGSDVKFSNRNGDTAVRVASASLVSHGSDPVLSQSRASASESPSRVSLSYVRHDSDYAAGAVESALQTSTETSTTTTSIPVVLSDEQARLISDRWLAESNLGRETIETALPLSLLKLTPGDVIEIPNGALGSDFFRVDRVEDIGQRNVTGTRVSPTLYSARPARPATRSIKSTEVATPAHTELLDLPLLAGEESPLGVHIAVTKRPWSGAVAVYDSVRDSAYVLSQRISRAATVGEILDELPEGPCGRWLGHVFRVRLISGALERRSALDVLNGANTAAVRADPNSDWEVIQFSDAEIDPDLQTPWVYRLGSVLRGQAGTDGISQSTLPSGARFVLLDGALGRITLPSSAIGLDRHYRVGPYHKPYDSPSFTHHVHVATGVGMRPYRPVHIRFSSGRDGTLLLEWTRRTRIQGDSWMGSSVPLAEETELYHVRISSGTSLIREFFPTMPRLEYSSDTWTLDGNPKTIQVEIAQQSTVFGDGNYTMKKLLFNDNFWISNN
ncbi:MAG: glycoside hydrolase/phage tail family protein [Pseudomonadota bacterium]